MDTSALVALAVSRDRHHAAAARYLKDLPPGATLLASDYVMDETLTRPRGLVGHDAAVRVGAALRSSPLALLVRVEDADLEAAWEVLRRHGDHELSFTDGTVVAMA